MRVQFVDIGDPSLEHIREMIRLTDLMLSTIEQGGHLFSADKSMQVIGNFPSLKVLRFGKTELSSDQMEKLLNDRELEMFMVDTTDQDEESRKRWSRSLENTSGTSASTF